MKKMLLQRIVLALVCWYVVPADAQNTVDENRMRQFRNDHPQAKFYGEQYFDGEGFFETVGAANTVYGTVLSTGETPEESATNLCEQLEGIYCVEQGELTPAVLGNGATLQELMWDRTNQRARFHACRFNQTVAGIPVFRSGIGILMRNEDTNPAVISSNNLKELQGFNAAAGAFVVPNVTDVMKNNTEEFLSESAPFIGGTAKQSVLDNPPAVNPPEIKIDGEELVIWAGVSNVRVQPELAISFMVERGTVSNPDQYRRYMILAAVDNGEILYTENQVSTLDVNGTVAGNATENGATFVCGPESEFALPYAGIEVVGGASGFADTNGNFDLAAPNGNVTLRSTLRGQFFEVRDQAAGNSIPFIEINVASPDSVDIIHNPASTQLSTANINAYLHSNIVRDFVLSFEPNYPVIANQTLFDINTNINDSCNAFYNGVSTNYFTSGGGCNNTAYGDVVYHEYGHHLVNVTGNGQGQFGEGTGDTIAMLIEDDPVLGQGFNSCGVGIRSALNFRTFPCEDQFSPHDCGQLLSGSVWDLRTELASVDSANALDITSELFIGMLIARGVLLPGSPTIDPTVAILFLELDDDDSEIGNGTPHYDQIATAFNSHNLQVPELELLTIAFTNGTPATIDPAGGTTFEVEVTELGGVPVNGTGVLNVDTGSGFEAFPMTQTSPTTYEAEFPASECSTMVAFFVTADAAGGTTVSFPLDAPSDSFTTISAANALTPFLDSFDADQGWAVTGNAVDGQWQRAIPNNGDRGDPAVDAEAEGAGFAFVTDNGNTAGDDNSDVDSGSTILTSPILDASVTDSQIAYVSYFRWYSNSFGAGAFSDEFVVEISNDAGATWVNLETVGPTGPEVSGGWIKQQLRISDFVDPTNQVQLRFTASDLGTGSVIEAGVDGVEVMIIDCESEVIPGDVNGDGVVNLLDVTAFVDLLANNGFNEAADINGDGFVNLLDVGPFVDLLAGN